MYKDESLLCFVVFCGCCVGLVLSVASFYARAMQETHKKTAQADLCTSCTYGGSTRAKITGTGLPQTPSEVNFLGPQAFENCKRLAFVDLFSEIHFLTLCESSAHLPYTLQQIHIEAFMCCGVEVDIPHFGTSPTRPSLIAGSWQLKLMSGKRTTPMHWHKAMMASYTARGGITSLTPVEGGCRSLRTLLQQKAAQ